MKRITYTDPVAVHTLASSATEGALEEEITSEPNYGALRGRVVAAAQRSNHVSPHYQIMFIADGDPWRVAVNVKSTDTSLGS